MSSDAWLITPPGNSISSAAFSRAKRNAASLASSAAVRVTQRLSLYSQSLLTLSISASRSVIRCLNASITVCASARQAR